MKEPCSRCSPAPWRCAVVVSLAAAGCGIFAASPALPPAPPAASAVSSEIARPDPALSSTLPVILQARLRVVAKGVPQDSWIDFEVNGPARYASAVCKTLVERETKMNLPSELRIEVARPCAREAIAEPPASTRFALVRVEHYDQERLLLSIGTDVVPEENLGQLRVRRRDLSGYDDEASCAAIRDRLENDRTNAEKDAQAKAGEWLGEMIGKQRCLAAEACKRPESDECRKTREMIALLEKRKAKGPEPPPSAAPAAICRRR